MARFERISVGGGVPCSGGAVGIALTRVERRPAPGAAGHAIAYLRPPASRAHELPPTHTLTLLARIRAAVQRLAASERRPIRWTLGLRVLAELASHAVGDRTEGATRHVSVHAFAQGLNGASRVPSLATSPPRLALEPHAGAAIVGRRVLLSSFAARRPSRRIAARIGKGVAVWRRGILCRAREPRDQQQRRCSPSPRHSQSVASGSRKSRQTRAWSDERK
jgi:hypothetical protein